jgi:uncharacterized protein YjiS (DUF1127 family)
MTMLALSALIRTASGLLRRLAVYCAQFLAGVEEARAMALAYQDLANLSDRDLAARGLTRADIPRAVLAAFNRG